MKEFWDFYSNNSGDCKVVEDKLNECGIPYNRKYDASNGDIFPTIQCQAGILRGLDKISLYLFPECEDRKSK